MNLKNLVHMTVEKAAEMYGDELAEKSLEKEFRQYHEKKTFRGVPKEEELDAKLTVGFKTFAKEKKDSEGNMTSLKPRGVLRGDQQHPEIYERMGSPTASTTSLSTVATISAYEGKKTITYDFPAAYLNAKREGRAPKLFVKFDRFQTKVMNKVDPNWSNFVLPDGTSRAEVVGSIYGALESGALWNEDVTNLFLEMGLIKSKFDPCVFQNKEKTVRIVLYVDDLYITYRDENDIKNLKDHVLGKFGGEFKYPVEGCVEFLGMKMQSKDGGIYVTMLDKIDDVTEGVQGQMSTPAGNNLFEIDENSKELTSEEKKKFHTLVAKLLYIAKRVRPDILLAVNFLTTRVQHPRNDDQNKLFRVLKYLNGTKEYGLTLNIGNSVFVNAYIDASFGVHSVDGRSHTGAVVGIGEATAILAKSTKQKLVTKSSTEAELVAVTDVVGDVLDLKGFVEETGYQVNGNEKSAVIYQDNQSTMKLMENGPPSSSKSKHVRIRTFWVRELLTEGEVKVTFKPTDEMVADGLTKPLQGEKKFADQILGRK